MFTKKNAVLTLTLAALSASTAAAQTFDLSWHTIDGGGATFSSGAGFTLGGTIGQPDAGAMSGGAYTLSGGFWFTGQSPCTLEADLDSDGDVDLSDLATLLSHFGTLSGADHSDGNIEGADGDVDLADLSLILSQFGSSCP